VQPAADTIARRNAAGSADQHEERRLKRIFGIMTIAQDAPAYTQHHRTVSAH
jgi:hypothetical protein